MKFYLLSPYQRKVFSSSKLFLFDPLLQNPQTFDHVPLPEEAADRSVAKPLGADQGGEDFADLGGGEGGVIQFGPSVGKIPVAEPSSPIVGDPESALVKGPYPLVHHRGIDRMGKGEGVFVLRFGGVPGHQFLRVRLFKHGYQPEHFVPNSLGSDPDLRKVVGIVESGSKLVSESLHNLPDPFGEVTHCTVFEFMGDSVIGLCHGAGNAGECVAVTTQRDGQANASLKIRSIHKGRNGFWYRSLAGFIVQIDRTNLPAGSV